jgi:hypothetical protein
MWFLKYVLEIHLIFNLKVGRLKKFSYLEYAKRWNFWKGHCVRNVLKIHLISNLQVVRYKMKTLKKISLFSENVLETHLISGFSAAKIK